MQHLIVQGIDWRQRPGNDLHIYLFLLSPFGFYSTMEAATGWWEVNKTEREEQSLSSAYSWANKGKMGHKLHLQDQQAEEMRQTSDHYYFHPSDKRKENPKSWNNHLYLKKGSEPVYAAPRGWGGKEQRQRNTLKASRQGPEHRASQEGLAKKLGLAPTGNEETTEDFQCSGRLFPQLERECTRIGKSWANSGGILKGINRTGCPHGGWQGKKIKPWLSH